MEKAREFWKKICFCFIDHMKAFDCVDHNKLWKILHGTTDWSELVKEYDKAVHCHPVNLTSMQSTSCQMPGW